jgi:hypothetical protein
MDLSIIIVNWNTHELLVQCLQSIAENVRTCERVNVETFVVDNASTDGSAEMVRERFPWVRLIENAENVGFARANNQALREATGRYAVLLNSDAELLPGTLQTLVDFMDAHPEAGACGPLLFNGDGQSLQPSCHPVLTPWREFWRLAFLDRVIPRATYPMERWERSQPREVEVIKGACLVLRREALDQVGVLDEQYFMYTEEMDLCYRLAHDGWKLYWVPQARVIHHGEASSKQVAEEMYLQLYRSKVQFHRKFGGEGRVRWFKFLVALAYLPRWAAAGVGQLIARKWRPRARVYRRMLRELGEM